MEKRERLEQLQDRNIYATEESMIRWVEFTGENAEFHNAMHCFLMRGLDSEDVSVNFIGQTDAVSYAALKVLEMPLTLTVVHGGEEPAYAYYMDGKPSTRAAVLDSFIIEEALLNMEDTGRYVWDILNEFFGCHDIRLGAVDLTFAHLAEHFIVLCGELTPNTMMLFDPETGKRLWSGEEGAYELIMQRISG